MNCISFGKGKKGGGATPPPPPPPEKPGFGYMIRQDDPDYIAWVDQNLRVAVDRAAVSVDGVAGKWPNMLSRESTTIFDLNTDRFEASIKYAEDRGHLVKWHQAVGFKPKWVPPQGYDLSSRAQREMDNRMFIRTVLKKFGHRIDLIDVCGEPLDPQGRGFRQGPGIELITLEEIAGYFLHCRMFTDAELGVNEFGCENVLTDDVAKRKHDHLVHLCEWLVAQGAPIRYVGLQAHLRAWGAPTYDEWVAAITPFREMGLDVHITENDCRLANTVPYPIGVTADSAQQEAVEAMVQACVDQQVKLLMSWGLTDNKTWLEGKFGVGYPDERPLPFTPDGKAKAYWRAIDRGVK